MNFRLTASANNVSFTDLDLFPEQRVTYDADFYDDKEVSKIKLPILTDIRLPFTPANKSFFGYDPEFNNVSQFPTGEYHYILYIDASTTITLRGILTVEEIEYNSSEPYMTIDLKDYISYFFKNIKDRKLGDILTQSHYTSRHTMADFFDTTANGGEAGTIDQNPDYTRIVNFPFVDMCNDTKKFGYEARQFVEYGVDKNRVGLIPVLSVSQYLKQIGSYLSTTQVPVKVKSRLFGINETASITDLQPEKLQAVIPAKLQAKVDTNTRTFTVNNPDFGVYPNEDMTGSINVFGNTKLVTCRYYGQYEYYGHYGATPTGYNPRKKYALEVLDNSTISSANDESGEKGYIAPYTNFKARVKFIGGARSITLSQLDYEVPLVEEDKAVYRINNSASNMKFNIYAGVFADGQLLKKIRLQDTDGDPIELTATSASTVEGNSNKDDANSVSQFTYQGTGLSAYFDSTLHGDIKDVLRWNNIEVFLPADEETEIDLVSESKYGIAYFIEPSNGTLEVEYITSYAKTQLPNQYYYSTNSSTSNFSVEDFRKAITLISNYDDLNLQFEAIEDFNPYFETDEYIIKDSINNTCELTPADFVSIVCKRFGCGVFYEFDGTHHVLRVDPLHLLRTTAQSIDSSIDDLRSIKLSRPKDKVRDLVINNADDGLFYDKHLTTSSTLNAEGINDLEISFQSSIYDTSLCGDEVVFSNNNVESGVLTEHEVGFTDNVFTPYTDFTIRFAYLDKPLYSTNIKVPYVTNDDLISDLVTRTQRLFRNIYNYSTGVEMGRHVFNGRLFPYNPADWDLRFEDELENDTDYKTLFKSTEYIKSKNSISIEFSMVVPTSQLSNLEFMLRRGRLSYINNQNVLIKNANGQVYADYAYLDIKGIIE